MTTPNGNIIFNANEGSDTQASGLGPRNAVYGSTATINSTSSTVTGIDTTGVRAGDLLWVQSSTGRQFNVIQSVLNQTSVACDNNFDVAESGRTWAIGGKRATLDNSDSRRLIGHLNVSDLPSEAWVELETDQTFTSSVFGRGSRRIKSRDGARYTILFDFSSTTKTPCMSGGGYFSSILFAPSDKDLIFGQASTSGYAASNLSVCLDCHFVDFSAFGAGFSRLFQIEFYRCILEDVYVRSSDYGFTANDINGGNSIVRSYGSYFKNCGTISDPRSELYQSVFTGNGMIPLSRVGPPRLDGCVVHNYTSVVEATQNLHLNTAYQVNYTDAYFSNNLFHTISSDIINMSSSSLEFYRMEVRNNFYYNVNNFCNVSGVEQVVAYQNRTLSSDPLIDAANGDLNINATAGGGATLRSANYTLGG